MCLRWFWSKEREGGERKEGREEGREEGEKEGEGGRREERRGGIGRREGGRKWRDDYTIEVQNCSLNGAL